MKSEETRLLCSIAQVAIHLLPTENRPEVIAAIESGKGSMNEADLAAFMAFVRTTPRPLRQAFDLLMSHDVYSTLDKSARDALRGYKTYSTKRHRSYYIGLKAMRKCLIRSGIFTEILPDVWCMKPQQD